MNASHTYQTKDITAIVLAGGLGTRMGGVNKSLLMLNDLPFIAHSLQRLAFQSHIQIISANQSINQYKTFNKHVIQDIYPDNQGPLAGILSCASKITTPLILTVPCDAPLFPENLVDRLLKNYNGSQTSLCVVDDGDRLQSLFMLFDNHLLDNMQQFFNNNQRKVGQWIRNNAFTRVDFSDMAENFINVNDPETLKLIQASIKSDK